LSSAIEVATSDASEDAEPAILHEGPRTLRGAKASLLTVQGYPSKKDACTMCFANGCKASCLVGKCFRMYGDASKQPWCTACTTWMEETKNDMGRQDECSAGFNANLPKQPWHTRWWYTHHTGQLTADFAAGPLQPTVPPTTTPAPKPVKKKKKKKRKKRKGKGRKKKKAAAEEAGKAK